MLAAVRHRLGSADLLLTVTVLVWSFHFVVIKYSLTHGFLPLVYATLRFGCGSLIFAGIAYGREGTFRIRRRDVLILCVVAPASIYVNQISFATAVTLTTASTLALLFGTLPIFVVLIGWRLGVESPHLRHWIAAGVSFLGVALVAVGAGGGLSGDVGGILVGMLAPITWGLFSVVAAPMLRRYSPYRISAVVGLVVIVPLAVTAIPQTLNEDWSAIGSLAWAALAYSIILSLVVTNIWWFKAIDRVGANRASIYANLQPFLGALFAVLALGDTMNVLQILGGIVIAAGIVIARSRKTPVEIVD